MAIEIDTTTIDSIKSPDAGSIAMGPFGSNIRKENYHLSGVPVIRGINLNAERFLDNGFVYLTEEKADELRRSNAFHEDLIFTAQGTIGQVGIIPKNAKYERYVLSQNLMKVTCNKDKVDPLFVFYFFRSQYGQHEILSFANPTGVPCISKPLTSLKQFSLPLLPLPEQKAIAYILGKLDDKIELNRKMNATLEAISQAIFKSWFVDFDPVRAKAEGRQPIGMDAETVSLFPDSFVDSELGKIPKGWSVGTLDVVTKFVWGGDWGKATFSDATPIRVHCIRGADIPDIQHADKGNCPSRFIKIASLQKRELKPFDLVIEISGGSPTQQTGRTILIIQSLLSMYDTPIVCTNFCRMLRTENDDIAIYAYRWLRRLYEKEVYWQYESGTTGIKNLDYKALSTREALLLPDPKILRLFGSIAKNILTIQGKNGHHSLLLADIRNTLLPKLLSGEIRIKDTEKFAENVT